MPGLGRSVSIAVFLVGVSQSAFAQVDQPSAPAKNWNLDFTGGVGVSPGMGAATTSLDLSGAVTVLRTTHQDDEFHHRCRGLTARFSGSPNERSLMVGPQWDAGDPDGTLFVRVLAGVRKPSSPASELTPAVGAGVGMAVGPILLDVNWIVSPWAERAPQRLSVSLGYTWSFPFKAGS